MHPDQVDSQVAPDEHLSLTDQDVNILHQIITRAEQHEDVDRLPFRAIFAAYDDVLEEHGLDPRQDEVCFRFLFQLGSRFIDGHGLYEKFLNLLSRMGIRLMYDDDDDDDDDHDNENNDVRNAAIDGKSRPRTARDRPAAAQKVKQKNETKKSTTAAPAAPTTTTTKKEKRKPKRRASFNSMYDATEDVSQRASRRPSSRSSVSRLETGTEMPQLWREAGEHDPGVRSHHQRRLSRHHHRSSSGRNQVPRIAKHIPAEDLSHPEVEAKFQSYSAAKSKGKQTRHGPNDDLEEQSSLSSSSSSSISGDEDNNGAAEQNNDSIQRAQLPPELVYRPSLSDLLRNASTFNMYRQRNELRRLLRTWRDKTARHHELFEHLYKTAANRDALTLERQAFDIWHAGLLRKRHEAETERLFNHLEEEAVRARDLYLLGQALSRWRGRTAEETEKTQKARRHILAVKYFKAWEEITAVHELKVRKFTLQKPLRRWREKIPQIQQNERAALAVYHRHLTKTMYWRWFWAFCDRRAPAYRNSSLKQKHLVLWIRALRTNRELEAEAIAQDGYVLLHASFHAWKNKREILAEAENAAVRKWKHKRLHDCLLEWNVKTRLGDAACHITTAMNVRVARSAFDTWLHKARSQRQAKDMDKYRLLRSAWTDWNDKLRIQALSQRIDERIVMQVLYKWLLVGRQQLMQRIHDQRLVREAYDKMFIQTKKTFNRLLNREEEFRLRWQRKLMSAKLNKWKQKLQVLKQRETTASAFYLPGLERDIIDVWRKRLKWHGDDEKSADQARYYFLMTRVIAKWREATRESTKKHRLSAYALIRRRHKMNLASKALVTWTSKTQALLELEDRADIHFRETTKSLSSIYLTHWYGVTSTRAQHMHDADVHYNRKLVRVYLDRMLDLRLIHRDQEERSTQLFDAHISRVAGVQLRKLSLRLFQLRANSETADRQKERYVRKQVKGILRQWLEKTRNARTIRRSSVFMNRSSISRSSFRQTEENVVPSTPLNARTSSRASRRGEGTPLNPKSSFRASRRGEASERQREHERERGRERVNTPIRFEIPERPSAALNHSLTPAGAPTTSAYLTDSARPRVRTKQLSADITTTPATPSVTPFAARFLTQLSNGTRPYSSGGGLASGGRRTFHRRGKGKSSLATVRFADEEEDTDDPEHGSPSKGRSILRSSFQADLEAARKNNSSNSTNNAATTTPNVKG